MFRSQSTSQCNNPRPHQSLHWSGLGCWEITDQRQFLLLKNSFLPDSSLGQLVGISFKKISDPTCHISSFSCCLYRSDDDYDEAIGTLLSIGASVLKVAGEKILEYYNSSEEMFNNFIINTMSIIEISGELREEIDKI